MTVTTWTLTGDVSDLAGDDWPTTGATKAEAYLTAYDADGPVRFYVDTSTGGKVRFGPTIPITLASDGTFTRAGIPDSSETGLSYALTLTYRPTGHGRSVATTTDRFTLDADKALNQVGFVNPDFSPEVLLVQTVDNMVTDLMADDTSATYAAVDAEIAPRRGRWPVVTIVTDGAAPIVDTVTYINGDYTITDTDAGVIHSGGLRIRGRGNSTWALPKKPYRLNFDVATAPLGMTATQKNWALLANHFDNAKVNNAMALALGDDLTGLDWTPEYRIVEVVLNGDFLGLYQLADLVRVETGRVVGPAANADTGSGLTGAYLIEVADKESPQQLGASAAEPGWHTSRGHWMLYDTPEAPTATQDTYIRAWVNDFETALYSATFADPTTGWRAYADEDSFADWYLINELFRNADSYLWSSCKMVKGRDGKLHMGPLWDFDLSLGIGWQATFPSTGFRTRNGDWFFRLWQDAGFRATLATRWALLLAALGDYQATIDRLVDAETLAVGRDDTRWTQTTYPPMEADARKRWLADRIAWLGTQITGDLNAVPPTVTATV